MKSISLISLTLAVVSTGCHTNQRSQAYISSLQGEIRALEDVIFDQRHEMRNLRSRLDRAGGATDSGGDETGGGGGLEIFPPRITPGGQPQGSGVEPPPDADLTPPVITPGHPVKPDDPPDNGDPKSDGGDRQNNGAAPANEPSATSAGSRRPLGMDLVSPALPIDDRLVTKIRFNPRFTGGRNVDDAPGDDVLEIGLEPQDMKGRVLLAARPISIVVLDPSQELSAARVARWDFTKEQVSAALRHTGSEPVIRLEGTWPKRPPKNGRIHVFARYSTSDGRYLETKHIVQIETADAHSARWTPRAPQRAPSAQSRSVANERPAQFEPPTASPLDAPIADPAAPGAPASARRLPWSPTRQQ
ncbi:MAG: hypothetical protein QGG36_07430 [Pirellulaceae bacterium]|jgi:hypothetical protein|nr:hypothetical protein [Pirellulaceae bacterium]MDP7015615.1 hypothetical protein [Pirellulaceae bacterium]